MCFECFSLFIYIRFSVFIIYAQAKQANKRFFSIISTTFFITVAVAVLCCRRMHRLNFNGAIIKLRFIVACNHVNNGNQAK